MERIFSKKPSAASECCDLKKGVKQRYPPGENIRANNSGKNKLIFLAAALGASLV